MNIQNRCLLCSAILVIFASAEQVPKQLLEGLSSDQFKVRESSQAELEKWADEKGSAGVTAIYRVHMESDDPEIRSRCLEALRTQSDKDYLKDGIGYLGVQMREEMVELPGDDKPRVCIRITLVQPGSQAEVAGIIAGDLIASLDGKKWYELGALDEFSKAIASFKPLRKIIFEIKRAEVAELIEVPVVLGKRPVDDLRMLYYNDPEQLEKEAREKHFDEWFKKLEKAK